jgi:hypothetical protein
MAAITWVAPSAEEQELWIAQQREDKQAYIAALARTDVFVARPLDANGKSGFRKDPEYATVRRGLKQMLPVYTRGVMPDHAPDGAYWDNQMFPQWVKDLARQRSSTQLLVNAGTPLQRDLTVGEAAAWVNRNPQRVLYWNDLRGTVRTLMNEPVDGELARGLACNAHLSVMNARPWNTMGHPFMDYKMDRDLMKTLWLIDGAVDWQNKIDKLLDREKHPWPADLVFGIRMEREAGVKPSGDLDEDTAVLTEAVDAWCRDQYVGESMRLDMADIARWIPRIEAWMRRDGLLPADEIVQTQAVFHWARCINMAREGLACRYGERTAAEQIVVHAGRLCARTYADWEQLSRAYIIGRVIQMGREGKAETLYAQSLHQHRLLMQSPFSPWVRLSLREETG